MKRFSAYRVGAAAITAGAVWFSCSGDKSPGTTGDGSAGDGGQGDGAGGKGGTGAAGGGAGGGVGGGAGTDGPKGPGPGCVPGTTQCTDCVDNDGDGYTDYYDGECVGPADNDESSYATGIPGDNVDPCKQDCFFDGDSGMGNDGCEWELKCDAKNPGKDLKCPYDPSYKNCPDKQSEKCIMKCGKLTPNGCDCFGCCTLMGHDVLLVPSCTVAKLDDPKACPPCTKSTSCSNPCDRCEICIGKPTIPDDCPRPDAGVPDGGPPPPDGGVPPADGPPPPPPPSCPTGTVACGPGGVDPASCPTGTVCVTGCCINYVP